MAFILRIHGPPLSLSPREQSLATLNILPLDGRIYINILPASASNKKQMACRDCDKRMLWKVGGKNKHPSMSGLVTSLQ